jgi:hypothetical protein
MSITVDGHWQALHSVPPTMDWVTWEIESGELDA